MPLEAPYFSLIAPTLTAHLGCDKRLTQLPTLQIPGKNNDYQATQSEANMAFIGFNSTKISPREFDRSYFKTEQCLLAFKGGGQSGEQCVQRFMAYKNFPEP